MYCHVHTHVCSKEYTCAVMCTLTYAPQNVHVQPWAHSYMLHRTYMCNHQYRLCLVLYCDNHAHTHVCSTECACAVMSTLTYAPQNVYVQPYVHSQILHRMYMCNHSHTHACSTESSCATMHTLTAILNTILKQRHWSVTVLVTQEYGQCRGPCLEWLREFSLPSIMATCFSL